MKKYLLSIFALLLPLLNFAQEAEKGLDQKIDEAFQPIADGFFDAIFFPVYKSDTIEIPFVLVIITILKIAEGYDLLTLTKIIGVSGASCVFNVNFFITQ